MNTTVIFNTDLALKKAAMRKAHERGLTLTTVLNLATRAFVNDAFTIDIVGNDIARARASKKVSSKKAHQLLGLDCD